MLRYSSSYTPPWRGILFNRLLKNYCATLIRACIGLIRIVLGRLRRSGPSIVVAGRCERARQCHACFALALMYSPCTLRVLRPGSINTVRTRLKAARDVFQ